MRADLNPIKHIQILKDLNLKVPLNYIDCENELFCNSNNIGEKGRLSLVTFHVSDLKFSVKRPAYLGLKWGSKYVSIAFSSQDKG